LQPLIAKALPAILFSTTTSDKPKISLLDETEQLRIFFHSMSDLTIKRQFPRGRSEEQMRP